MIKKLDWSKGPVIAYEASGIITKDEHTVIFSEIAELISRYKKIRIFVQLPKMAWPQPASIPLRIKFAIKYLGSIERYVVVSDSKILFWFIELVGNFFGFFTGVQYKLYTFSDEILAKFWILSGIHRDETISKKAA